MSKFVILASIAILLAFNLSYSKKDSIVLAKNFSDYELRDINADSKGNLYLATKFGGLYKSSDIGKSWSLANRKTMGYDIHSILVSDFEGLYLGLADTVMLQSTDEGATWLTRFSNYGTGAFYISSAMVGSNKRYKIFICDNAVYESFDNFTYCGISEHRYSALFKTNSGSILAVGDGFSINSTLDGPELVYYGWATWRDSLAPIYTCINSDKKGRLYIGSQKGFFYSDDEAKHVYPFVSNLSEYSVSAVYADDSKILVGTDSAGLFISYDNANSWDNLNTLNIKSKINKIFAFKNSIFVLTQKDGLFFSNDNATSWAKFAGDIREGVSDTTEPTGWIPSVNFYDLYPKNKDIYKIKFVNDDSLIFVQDSVLPLKFYNANTGKLHSGFTIPDSAHVDYFNVINSDSVIVVYKKDTVYKFGVYLIQSRTFKEYFSVNLEEFLKTVKFNYHSSDPSYLTFSFKELLLNYKDSTLFIHYIVNFYINSAVGWTSEQFVDIRSVSSGEIKKRLGDIIMTENFEYYLRDIGYLINIYDNLGNLVNVISDLASQSENFCCPHVSPKNKYITMHHGKQSALWIYPFLNENHVKEIQLRMYGYVTPYFLSNEDYIITYGDDQLTLYVINESNLVLHSLDYIMSFIDDLYWEIATSKNTNTVVFGGADGKLHKWTPLSQLTSVGKDKETIVENIEYLYPNPASSYLTIPKTEICDNAQIFTILGENSGEANIIDGKIDVSGLYSGIYFLKINSKFYKFIKL